MVNLIHIVIWFYPVLILIKGSTQPNFKIERHSYIYFQNVDDPLIFSHVFFHRPLKLNPFLP